MDNFQSLKKMDWNKIIRYNNEFSKDSDIINYTNENWKF